MSTKLSPLFSWRGAICDSGLPPITRLVAFTLSLHMNERGGSCYPGIALLARESGLAESTVREHIHKLIDAGWLKRSGRVRGGRSVSPAYTACLPNPPGAGGFYAKVTGSVPETHRMSDENPPGAGGEDVRRTFEDAAANAKSEDATRFIPDWNALHGLIKRPPSA
jgi:hypothetical protein